MANPSRSTGLLVTGAAGKLGRYLRAAWAAGRAPGTRPVFLSRGAGADIRWSPGAPPPALPRCDTLVALWGVTSGPPEALALNAALARESLALARACGARRVLHFSSAAVYGPGRDLAETAPVAPVSPYGKAKAAMERAVAGFACDDIGHCCLRLANVVGADSLAPALAPSDAPVIMNRFADGRGPLRSYIAPGDLARVLAALARMPPGDIPAVLNVTAPNPVGMADLAAAAGRPIRWQPAPPQALQAVTLSGARLASLLPRVELRRTADEMIADWQGLEAPA